MLRLARVKWPGWVPASPDPTFPHIPASTCRESHAGRAKTLRDEELNLGAPSCEAVSPVARENQKARAAAKKAPRAQARHSTRGKQLLLPPPRR